jgi:hypothetical protein
MQIPDEARETTQSADSGTSSVSTASTSIAGGPLDGSPPHPTPRRRRRVAAWIKEVMPVHARVFRENRQNNAERMIGGITMSEV